MNRRNNIIVLPGLLLYYLYFAIPAIGAKWATDDPMNIRTYWNRGFWRCVGDLVNFWGGGYRPVGALFYLPLFRFFHLNPVPYRIAILTCVAATTYLLFRLVLELTNSSAVAAIAAAVSIAHPEVMVANYYNTSFLYDDFAALFTAATLFAYLRWRQEMTASRIAIVVILYLAAINSKESAVVAAAWIVGYELIVGRPRQYTVPAILCGITLLYLSGRVFGPHSLSQVPGYGLEITPARFAANTLIYLNDLFFHTTFFRSTSRLVIFWIAIAALCALFRRRSVWWACLAAFASTLPVAFTTTPRGGASLYVASLAWILFAATIFAAVPIRPNVRWAAAVVLGCVLTYSVLPSWRDQVPAYLEDHRVTWSVISQLQSLHPKPAPHSRVLFVNDPFDNWDMALIANLYFDDHTMEIDLSKKLDHPPDLASYDWVLAFEDGKLRTVRTP